jgi:hypothetical protein
VVVFMSDHGAGEVHNRPFLHMLMPRTLIAQQPEIERTLFHNQLALVSAYDLHRTFHHFATFPERPPLLRSSLQFRPSYSLLETPIDLARTCEDARVPLDHCFCEPWTVHWMINRELDDFLWLSQFAMHALNSDAGIRDARCPRFHWNRTDNLGWKFEQKTKRTLWQLELVTNEGNPNRYHLYVTQMGLESLPPRDRSLKPTLPEMPPVEQLDAAKEQLKNEGQTVLAKLIDLRPDNHNNNSSSSSNSSSNNSKVYITDIRPLLDGEPIRINRWYEYRNRLLMFTRLKQITRYQHFESCVPEGASPEFCVCNNITVTV